MEEDVDFKGIAQAHRGIMRDIWERWHSDPESLEGEEKLLAEQMVAHQKYHEIWENIDKLANYTFDPAKEENPFLHISLHVTLERQIESADPPAAKAALDRLIANGEDPHDARHAVLKVLVQELYRVMTQSEEFDNKRYCEALETL